MPPRTLGLTIDIIIGILALTTAASARLFAAAAAAGEQLSELRLLLVPLIGAMIASGGMIMLSPAPETRRIVIGRAAFALLFGCATPQIAALLHPTLEAFLVRPVVLLVAGAFASMVFYALSKPFCARLYARSKDIADKAADQALDRVTKP